MKSKAFCNARASSLAILLLLAAVSAQNVVMQSSVAKQTNVVTVTGSQAKAIKNHSVGTWVRSSMTMDSDYAWSGVNEKHNLIIGASSSVTGWGDNKKGTDVFISMYQQKWKSGSAYLLAFDDAQDFSYLIINVNYTQLFGHWFYLYGAYNSELNVMFFALYSTYTQSWEKAYSSNTIVKHTITDFFQFSVGSTDVKKSNQLNGYVFNPEFKYKSSDVFYLDVAQLAGVVLAQQQPVFIGVPSKLEVTVASNETIQNPRKVALSNYQGADEYCATGSFQLSKTPTSVSSTLVFRLTTNSAEASKTYTALDRALSLSFESGKICMVTYLFNEKSAPASEKDCFDDAPVKINQQYYFYQGYSRSQGKVYRYLRVNGKDYTKTSTNVLHVDPNGMYAYIGGDGVQKTLNGSVTLSFEFGPGAYRETTISDIPTPKPVTPVVEVVVPATYKAAELLSSDPNQTKFVDSRNVDSKYISVVKNFAVHFWYRRDLNQPVAANLDSARNTQVLGGVSESSLYKNGNLFSVSVQYRAHSDGSNPAYVFVSNVNGQTQKKAVEYNKIDDQNTWHWVYYAWNKTKKELSYTVDLGNNIVITEVVSNVNVESVTDLQGLLGTDGTGMAAAPGEFYDFQFVYHTESYANDAASVAAYIKAHRSAPPTRAAKSGSYEFNPADTPVGTVTSEQISYADSYSVAVWAKWEHSAQFSVGGNVLVQLTTNTPNRNEQRLGDYALQIVVNPNSVEFTTYQMGYESDYDLAFVSQSVPITYHVGQWCLYYFGYERSTQTASGNVKCDTGSSGSVQFTGIDHVVPSQASIFIGKSFDHGSFVGELFKPTVFVNNKVLLEMKQPKELVNNRPTQSNCAVIFSECNFQNEIQQICNSIPELELKNIKGIYVPSGYGLRFFRQKNYNGLNVKFVSSVDCIDQTLVNQPDLSWKQLESLFNQGKIVFTNDNGETISMNDAKTDFFKNAQGNNLNKKLRKTKKGNTQSEKTEAIELSRSQI